MASPARRGEAGQALAAYAAKVEPPALKVTWGDAAQRAAEPTPDWLAEPTVESLRAAQVWLAQFQDDAALLLAPRWLDRVAAQMSGTYVAALRRERGQTAAAVAQAGDELSAAAAEKGAGLGPAALSAALAEKPGYNPLLLAALVQALERFEGPEDVRRRYAEGAMRATLLPEPADARAAASHPLLQMGLTYGVAPTGVTAAPGGRTYDAAVPGAAPVVYDLATLLEGVPGTPLSGLNYSLVEALNTIRPAAGAAAAPPPGDAVPLQCRRHDGGGVYRTLAAPGSPPLAAMLRGPRPLLAAYNALAMDALAGEPGALLDDPAALVEAYAAAADQPSGPYSAEAAASREAGPLEKLYAAEGRAAAAAAGAAVAASRYANAPAGAASLAALPGVADAYDEELALTALLGGYRVQEGWRRFPAERAPAAHASPVPALLRTDAGAAPSLKLYAARHGRPLPGPAN